MPTLAELKRKWEEERRADEGEDYETITLTVIDGAEGRRNLSLFTLELKNAVIVPDGVEKRSELKRLIEEGRMVKAVVRKRRWSSRVEEIVEVKELREEEIPVDGIYRIQPSLYGGLVLRGDGEIIILKPGTINYSRLERLFNEGVEEVAVKLSSAVVNSSNGMKKAYGVWIYPLTLESESESVEEPQDVEAEEKEEPEI